MQESHVGLAANRIVCTWRNLSSAMKAMGSRTDKLYMANACCTSLMELMCSSDSAPWLTTDKSVMSRKAGCSCRKTCVCEL